MSAICRWFEAWRGKARALLARICASGENVMTDEQADTYKSPLPDSCGGCAVPGIPYIALKFRDNFPIEYRDGDPERLKFWAALEREFKGIQLFRLYRGLDNARFKALIDQAQKSAAAREQRYDPPRFFQWFRVSAPAATRFRGLAERLRSQPEVEAVYIEQPGRPPSPINVPETNPKYPVDQFYLQAPVQGVRTIGGINAVHAWKYAPADTVGAGVNVVDYERGWGFTLPPASDDPVPDPINMNHLDLPPVRLIPFGIGNEWSSAEHGTNVLGVLAMHDNDAFGVGAAPGATFHVVTPVVGYEPDGRAVFDHEGALQAAIDRLRPPPVAVPAPFGDVLLIQHTIYDPSVPPPDPGTDGPPRKEVPLEFIPGYFNLIRLAVTLGITVVEAAGNGREKWTADPRLNLDIWPDTTPEKPFLPTSPDWRNDNVEPPLPFMDSGAVMVSCANMMTTAPVPLIPRAPSWAPIGKRIDCWGWASSVQTTSTNADQWKTNFGGTSSASAMVAGAAIILQGYALARTGTQLSPREMRRRLCNRTPGVHTAATIPGVSVPSGTPSDLVGVMPNLASLIP